MDIGRLIATTIIWLGCFSLVFANIMNSGSGIVTLGILFLAVIGSVPIWESKGAPPTTDTATNESFNQEKLKREDTYDQKMRLLMELMDEDERDAFKQTLKEQVINRHSRLADDLMDGELPFDAEEYDIYDRK